MRAVLLALTVHRVYAGTCCWSKSGDAASCGNYPTSGRGAICGNDGVTACAKNADCEHPVTLPAPTPTLKVPSFLSDYMVLQRGNATVWGWDAPGNSVSVRVVNEEDGSELASVSALASKDEGAWRVLLSVASALGNTTVVVSSSSGSVTLSNVAFGDVYLCSGQSNMVYPVSDAENGEAELANSNYPLLRILTLKDIQSSTAATDCATNAPYIWAPSSPDSLSPPHHGSAPPSPPLNSAPAPSPPGLAGERLGADLPSYPSAACWFGGRDIHVSLGKKVPIGLITAAWNGSPIESWMLPEMIADGTPDELGGSGTCGGIRPPVSNAEHSRATSIESEAHGGMFNGMIAPLLPMRLTGIWWYQGENNDIGKSGAFAGPWWYGCLFPAMIRSWRAAFDSPDLPFYYVLLAAGHTALLREAQTAASLLPNTAFASAIDLGATEAEMAVGYEPGHPIRKQEVGRRLALAARALIYGEEGVVPAGPAVRSYTLGRAADGAGLSVTLSFDASTAVGLHAAGTAVCTTCCNKTDGGSPVTFSDPDDGSLLKPASKVFASSFEIDAEAGTLVASVPVFHSTSGRVQVEFLFENAPQCAVYNGEGGADDHRGIVGQSWRANATLPEAAFVL